MCGERTLYMSASRSAYLYEAQKKIMEELSVPLLDVYEASYLSAFQTKPKDGRHYTKEFNRLLVNYLFGDA